MFSVPIGMVSLDRQLRGPLEVYRIAWWMCHYGASSAKRTKGYTNNRVTHKINMGKLKKSQRERLTLKTTIRTQQWWMARFSRIEIDTVYPLVCGAKHSPAPKILRKLHRRCWGFRSGLLRLSRRDASPKQQRPSFHGSVFATLCHPRFSTPFPA